VIDLNFKKVNNWQLFKNHNIGQIRVWNDHFM